MRFRVVANDPEIDPRFDVLRMRFVKERRLRPRKWISNVGRRRKSRLKRRLASFFARLKDHVPFLMRPEVEDLRRTKIIVRDRHDVPRRFVGILPISERRILNLMRSL